MDADPPTLDDLLARAARGLRRRWSRELEPLGVTPHAARALQVVAELGRPRLGVVADRLRIVPRSATEVVDALQERGLVERVPDDEDRRAICVTLTDAGRRALDEIGLARRRVADTHFGPLTEDERAVLAAILPKLDDSADDRGSTRSARPLRA